jgi:hypothetical protein
VVPDGITSTGWPAVRDKCRDLGVAFDEWQDGAGRLILAKRADGKLAAMVGGVGMSLARQVGKTYLFGALLFALAILRPGLLVIWTAHHSRTSGETFLAMQGFARRRRIAPYVQAVYKGSGDEAIVFRNGSRILFGARERGFGRGIPGVDVLMCDEAQILTDRALDNMLATLNTSALGLAIFAGTPPRPEDPSEAFARMRAEALSGEASDMVWIEFAADRDAKPDDRKQWARANPSFPHRTPTESILRLRKKLSPESFLREGLGIWDDDTEVASLLEPFWGASQGADGGRLWPLAFGVTVSRDRARAQIGVAGVRADGRTQVELVADGPGVVWAVNWLASRMQRWEPCAVVLDGTALPLAVPLSERGVDATPTSTQDRAQASASFFDALSSDRVRHPGEPMLDRAALTAERRELTNGFVWEGLAVGPLQAVTLAAHGLVVGEQRVPASAPSTAAAGVSETSELATAGF